MTRLNGMSRVSRGLKYSTYLETTKLVSTTEQLRQESMCRVFYSTNRVHPREYFTTKDEVDPRTGCGKSEQVSKKVKNHRFLIANYPMTINGTLEIPVKGKRSKTSSRPKHLFIPVER